MHSLQAGRQNSYSALIQPNLMMLDIDPTTGFHHDKPTRPDIIGFM